MRKQYYFRPSPHGLLAWDVERLIRLTAAFPRRRVDLADIRELDEPWIVLEGPPTWRQIVDHMALIQGADLSYPVILAADGSVMDGRHRIAKALLRGDRDIEVLQFPQDPTPDYVGCRPEELPY